MLRTVCALIALGAPSGLHAQTVSGAEELATPGWRVEHTVVGDISRDGRDDLVVVLKGTDPDLVIGRDGFGESPYDSNPRRLVVALGKADTYRVVADNGRLLSRRDNGAMSDPLESSPTIENGVLKVTLVHFMSAGGWDAGNRVFAFRNQDGGVRLIGYDRVNVHRGSGEIETVSVNFLTGRQSVANGSIEDDEDAPLIWSRLRLPPLWLDDLGDGFEFEMAVLSPD